MIYVPSVSILRAVPGPGPNRQASSGGDCVVGSGGDDVGVSGPDDVVVSGGKVAGVNNNFSKH